MPPGPSATSSTSGEFGSIVMSTSHAAATTSGEPAFRRWWAIGRPMMPRPMNPITCAMRPPWRAANEKRQIPRRSAKGQARVGLAGARSGGRDHALAPDPGLKYADCQEFLRRDGERARREEREIGPLARLEAPALVVERRGARRAERVGPERVGRGELF